MNLTFSSSSFINIYLGTRQSTWDAVKLFTVAAQQGDSLAQCHIGMMYRDGVGVTLNRQIAETWYAAKITEVLIPP